MPKNFRLILTAVFCLSSGILYAKTPDELRGFGRELFQYHFDRADRETDPSAWMREARLGKELALRSWERTVLELLESSDDPALLEEAAGEISRWSEEELERRWVEWLTRRFFSGAAEAALSEAVDSANKKWTWRTDDDGNILYNAETGDPEAVRPSEGREIEADKAAWRTQTDGVLQAELSSYQAALAARFPELLSYIPEERRGEFQNRLERAFPVYLSGKEAEFRALLAREERLFIARRTGDVWSLRKKNENESAQAVTARLLEDADAVCREGIASLEARIEAARAGTGDLALMGAEWLESFREQFDRGLKAWEYAGEHFLVRRMEWERDSGEYFLAGQEAWQNAFSQLEKERIAWEEKARELFESGEKLFSGASEQLQKAVAEAKFEFEKDAALRIESGVQRAEAWVDMYVTCGSVLSEVRESAAFWLSRFVDQKPPANALENGSLGSWASGILNSTARLTENQKLAGQELVRWSGLYVQYRDKAAEALSVLEKEFGLALGKGAGSLLGVLNANSEDFHLDEYQVEILRAEAVAGYWERRLAIAEAVSDYARELSAGRNTEAESIAAWKDAKAGYDAALELYEAAQEELRSAGTSVTSAQAALQNAAAALNAAERELETLNSQYSIQMAAYRVNSGDFILEELGAYYASLLALYENRLGNNSWYTARLSAARDYSSLSRLDQAGRLLTDIAAEDNAELRGLKLALLSVENAADWYFAASGIEAENEERAALEKEGVLSRLEREAKNGGRPALLLSVYRELSAYSLAAQKEAAAMAMKNLAAVFAAYGLETGEGLLPSAGRIGGALFAYCESRNIETSLAAAGLMLDIDAVTEALPDWVKNEFDSWKNAVLDWIAARAVYEGRPAGGSASEVKALYEYFSLEVQNRYYNGEDIEDTARQAAYYRYLYSYLSSYENKVNEITASGEHWRIYISSPFIDGYNLKKNDSSKLPPGSIEENGFEGTGIGGALSLEEALLADAREKAENERKKLESAFSLLKIPSAAEIQFAETAGRLLADPNFVLSESLNEYALEVAGEFYRNEDEKSQAFYAQEEQIKAEIARLGLSYKEAMPSGLDAMEQLEELSARLDAFRRDYQVLLGDYKNSAAAFARAGASYEALYTKTKNQFRIMEQTRFEYEKQDAVRRWAGTAYLKQSAQELELSYYREPEEELLYTRGRSERAGIALQALKDLYKNGEEKRPYNDDEYNRIYAEYQTSFNRMLLSLKAKQEVEKTLASEKSKNAALYGTLVSLSEAFLNPDFKMYVENREAAAASNSLFPYIGLNGQGQLTLLFDPATFRLKTADTGDYDLFLNYFKSGTYSGNGENRASAFEQALTGWANRMASCNLWDSGNFQHWGLAVNYLIRKLVENNTDVEGISGSYRQTDLRENGGMKLGSSTTLNDHLESYRRDKYVFVDGKRVPVFGSGLRSMQENAWNSLGEQGQDDVRFLVTTLLSGGAGSMAGLTRITELLELNKLRREAYSWSYDIWPFWQRVTLYHFPYTFDHSEVDAAKRVINPYRDAVLYAVDSSRQKTSADLAELSKAWRDYQNSCEKIKALTGLQEDSGKTEWTDLEKALTALDFSNDDIKTMELCWRDMLSYYGEQAPSYTNNASALEALMIWARGMRNGVKEKFEAVYLADESARQSSQEEYRTVFDAYINGKASFADLDAAAKNTYGAAAPAVKNHINNLGLTMLGDLGKISAEKSDYAAQYRSLAAEYLDLVERGYTARFSAELAARELEWKEREKDLTEKILAWREAAGLILERGRADWEAGTESMTEAYKRWNEDFEGEYSRVSAAWDAAWLESLEEKEAWMNRAIEAADNAYTGTLLSFVGSDAESLSRKLDMFIPSSIPGYGGIEEAGRQLEQVLLSSGIVNLKTAFASFDGIADTVQTRILSGSSGAGVWNSGQARASAKEFAHRGTADLAAGKMVLLAVKARETALEAKLALENNLESANKNFDDSMNETFLMGGGWARSGRNYIRDVIVHSTLFQSAITDRVDIEAYRYYVMDFWEFKTDLSDANLEGLDYLGIQALIALAQKEVQEKSESIFGSGPGDTGLYGAALGAYSPSESRGEMGRLLTEYYKWAAKQAEGIALMNSPPWDKPLWDSRGSWFAAPSLRTVVDIGITVVSAIGTPVGGMGLLLGAAYNLLDDAMFTAFDLVNGYKDWSEAGFSFGQKVLMSAASSSLGTVFNGVSKAVEGGAGFFQTGGLQGLITANTGTFGRTLADTSLRGLQGVFTSTVNSAIGSITYNRNTGFGWNSEAFSSSMRGGITSAVMGAASTFTSGTFGVLNLGEKASKVFGFSMNNKADMNSLNQFLGGLAGQGMNYIMTGDFNLNVLNADIFERFGLRDKNKEGINAGLLELHVGSGGLVMNLGSGGLDASYNVLSSAVKGAAAWGTNVLVNNYTKRDGLNLPVALRALYGFGDKVQKGELWDIINGEVKLAGGIGGYDGLSKTEDGKKTIYLGNYRDDMTNEEQMRLAAVLGHEAYRDGFGVGKTDANGNLVNAESNFAELKTASIARTMISDRISKDYDWFYEENQDFAFASELLSKHGPDGVFDKYLLDFFENDEDYLWVSLKASSRQSDNKYPNVPLLNSRVKAVVDDLNKLSIENAVIEYKERLAELKASGGDLGLLKDGKTDEEIFEYIESSKGLQAELGVVLENFYSLSSYGCMLYSAMYAAEALTGRIFDPKEVNRLAKEKGIYRPNGVELDNELFAKLVTTLTYGEFEVNLQRAFSELNPGNLAALDRYGKDLNTLYFTHIRVLGRHSEGVTAIEYEFDSSNGHGNIPIGVKSVQTANPYGRPGVEVISDTKIAPDKISRWDIYRAKPGRAYYDRWLRELELRRLEGR